jgi:hypothetical protein
MEDLRSIDLQEEEEAVCPHDLEEDRQWVTEPVGGTTTREEP